MIKLILACDLNGVIGNGNELPWGKSLPCDLQRFKELTEGHIVVMGRKTFESIGSKPLPNRENVVLSRSRLDSPYQTDFGYEDEPTTLYRSDDIGSILDQYDQTGDGKDLWIIGGMNVYKQFMPYAQEIYITEVQGVFEGDTGLDSEFSKYLNDDFNPESLGQKESDEKNKYTMEFLKFTRIKGEYN